MDVTIQFFGNGGQRDVQDGAIERGHESADGADRKKLVATAYISAASISVSLLV